MPENSAVAEPPVTEAPDRDLSSVFDQFDPHDESERIEPEKETKTEPEKVEKVEPVKKEEKPTTPEIVIPDILDEPEKKEVKVDEEPKPTPIPDNIKTEKARQAFAALDEKRMAAEKKARELEVKAKALEEKASAGDPDAKARIELLEKQLQGADALVQRALLQEHPAFQNKYVIPRQQFIEQAKAAFKDAGGDPTQIESALELKGKAKIDKLDELIGEVSSNILKGKLEGAVNAIDRIDQESTAVLKNSSEWNKRLQQQDQITRHKAFEQLEKTTKDNLSKASEILRDKFNIPLFKTFDDPKYSTWNDTYKSITENAEKIMLKTESPEEMAIAANMAAGFVPAWKLFVNEHKQHLETKKRLADYEKSEPGLGGTKTPRKSSEVADEEVPLAEAILQGIHSAQGRA